MRKILAILALVAVFLFVAFIATYTSILQTEKNDSKIIVVVTIPPQAEFVEKIGGDKVKVIVMVPPQASPHVYEPTPSQLKEVSKAKLYAKVGSGIEFERVWLNKILSLNKKMLVVDCSKGVKTIEKNGHIDPHIWLSPKNAKIMVENIAQGLIEVDPKNREYYEKNKEEYIRELDALDKKIAQMLSKKKNRKILVYHPSWTYFARDYGLEQISIEENGKEPTPQYLMSVIKEAKDSNITTIFVSPQFNIKNAEIIAKEINAKIEVVDPLARNYTANMLKVAKSFAKALK